MTKTFEERSRIYIYLKGNEYVGFTNEDMERLNALSTTICEPYLQRRISDCWKKRYKLFLIEDVDAEALVRTLRDLSCLVQSVASVTASKPRALSYELAQSLYAIRDDMKARATPITDNWLDAKAPITGVDFANDALEQATRHAKSHPAYNAGESS